MILTACGQQRMKNKGKEGCWLGTSKHLVRPWFYIKHHSFFLALPLSPPHACSHLLPTKRTYPHITKQPRETPSISAQLSTSTARHLLYSFAMNTCDDNNEPLYAWIVAPADGSDIISGGRIRFPQLICFARCKPNMTLIPDYCLVTASGCMNTLGGYTKDGVSCKPRILTAWCEPMTCSCASWEKVRASGRSSGSSSGPMTRVKGTMQSVLRPLSSRVQSLNGPMIRVKPEMIPLGRVSHLPELEHVIAVIEVDHFVTSLNDKATIRNTYPSWWDVPTKGILRIQPGHAICSIPFKRHIQKGVDGLIVAARNDRSAENIPPSRHGAVALDKNARFVVAMLCNNKWKHLTFLPFDNHVCKMLRSHNVDCETFYTALQPGTPMGYNMF